MSVPNYIKAYEDDSVVMNANNLVSTLNKMNVESNQLFDNAQNKGENSTTKSLIEALAKVKLDRMSATELV